MRIVDCYRYGEGAGLKGLRIGMIEYPIFEIQYNM